MNERKANARASWNTPAAADQCWVCRACGKHTEPGMPRAELRDVSCMMHAILCHVARGADGRWRAVVEP